MTMWINSCLHIQLPEHNRSYGKVSQGGGDLIACSGPIMGHLNSFSALGEGGGIRTKIQLPGGLPRGDV